MGATHHRRENYDAPVAVVQWKSHVARRVSKPSFLPQFSLSLVRVPEEAFSRTAVIPVAGWLTLQLPQYPFESWIFFHFISQSG